LKKCANAQPSPPLVERTPTYIAGGLHFIHFIDFEFKQTQHGVAITQSDLLPPPGRVYQTSLIQHGYWIHQVRTLNGIFNSR
ncbi:hypothetical protein, partial [Vibrio vulnificus]|uniref:hypothetical protein n=1 Tax=Vibrio vulnificus TaxID=672 RepID=UPI0039B3C8DD